MRKILEKIRQVFAYIKAWREVNRKIKELGFVIERLRDPRYIKAVSYLGGLKVLSPVITYRVALHLPRCKFIYDGGSK